MDMHGYQSVRIDGFMPVDTGGVNVSFTVMFAANSTESKADIYRHLMSKIDEKGQLAGSTIMVIITGKGICVFLIFIFFFNNARLVIEIMGLHGFWKYNLIR